MKNQLNVLTIISPPPARDCPTLRPPPSQLYPPAPTLPHSVQEFEVVRRLHSLRVKSSATHSLNYLCNSTSSLLNETKLLIYYQCLPLAVKMSSQVENFICLPNTEVDKPKVSKLQPIAITSIPSLLCESPVFD